MQCSNIASSGNMNFFSTASDLFMQREERIRYLKQQTEANLRLPHFIADKVLQTTTSLSGRSLDFASNGTGRGSSKRSGSSGVNRSVNGSSGGTLLSRSPLRRATKKAVAPPVPRIDRSRNEPKSKWFWRNEEGSRINTLSGLTINTGMYEQLTSAGGRASSTSADRPSSSDRQAFTTLSPSISSYMRKDRSHDTLFFPSPRSLEYLDGTLPGDYGFDPLGLFDPRHSGGFVNQRWLSYAEVVHGRWAMLGAVGCFGPEYLSRNGWLPKDFGVLWFLTGWLPSAGSHDFGMDAYTLCFIHMVLMGFVEMRRLQDYRKPGSLAGQSLLGLEKYFADTSGNPAYPGGRFFNFTDFVASEFALAEYQTKEIKHGRTAMVTMLGYAAQAMITGKGPYQNLMDHLANPVEVNVLTTIPRFLRDK